MSKMETILVIAAHPDDEVLGCGGTIAKHLQNGDQVHILIVAEGSTSRDLHRDPQKHQTQLSALAIAAHQASQILGGAILNFEQLPDNRLDSLDLLDVVKIIEKHIERVKPTIIYTHHYGDLNIDHQIVHRAVLTATRPLPDSSIKIVLAFEVPSSSEWQFTDPSANFSPNWFVDISQTLDIKLKALSVYSSEMREFPHPRSLEAVQNLTKWRGATVGVPAAEAFTLIRNTLF